VFVFEGNQRHRGFVNRALIALLVFLPATAPVKVEAIE
jgi:hypothetical protein